MLRVLLKSMESQLVIFVSVEESFYSVLSNNFLGFLLINLYTIDTHFKLPAILLKFLKIEIQNKNSENPDCYNDFLKKSLEIYW